MLLQDESEDEGEGHSDDGGAKKKKRRWRKNEPPKQHWVLMEKPEFIEKMTAKRRKKAGDSAAAAAGGEAGGEKLSSRYEALPEYNPSSYVMLTVGEESALLAKGNKGAGGDGAKEGEIRPPEHLTVTLLHGFHSFAQPDKIKALSMHEAEQAINDQRNRMTRYMMHAKKGGTVAAEASAVLSGGGAKPAKSIGMAKSRLLSKLSTKARNAVGDDAEDDDIMSDLAYRERKGGSGKARKELLTSLGDEGVTVDDDGVLGGQNDAMFGGKRRFGRFAVPKAKDANKGGDDEEGGKKKQDKDAAAGGDDNRTSTAGNDGMAMQDDFYQRDVGAEYEELDYDANELFDDDDVDVGETEEIDASGFAADIEDDIDDDSDDYDEDGGAKGIATIAGLKQLMAKDKGEMSEEEKEKAGDVDQEGRKTTAYGREDDEKDFDKIQVTSDQSDSEDKTKKEVNLTGVEVDDEGQRLISLKAVQKEIWLHHGEHIDCFTIIFSRPSLFVPSNHVHLIFFFRPQFIVSIRFYHNEEIDEDLQYQEELAHRIAKQVSRCGARAVYNEARQDRGQCPRSQATLLQGVILSFNIKI